MQWSDFLDEIPPFLRAAVVPARAILEPELASTLPLSAQAEARVGDAVSEGADAAGLDRHDALRSVSRALAKRA